jgi:hypothetical protein
MQLSWEEVVDLVEVIIVIDLYIDLAVQYIMYTIPVLTVITEHIFMLYLLIDMGTTITIATNTTKLFTSDHNLSV